jgi:hypothetical protein
MSPDPLPLLDEAALAAIDPTGSKYGLSPLALGQIVAAYFAALDREAAAERVAAMLYGIQRFGDSYADPKARGRDAALFFASEDAETRASWLFKARAALAALGLFTPDTEEER